jgi:hypothetical protein
VQHVRNLVMGPLGTGRADGGEDLLCIDGGAGFRDLAGDPIPQRRRRGGEHDRASPASAQRSIGSAGTGAPPLAAVLSPAAAAQVDREEQERGD